MDLRHVVVEVRHVQQRGGGLADGARHAGVGMTERGDGQAGAEVEVLAAVGVPHAHAIASHEHEGGAGYVRHQIGRRRLE